MRRFNKPGLSRQISEFHIEEGEDTSFVVLEGAVVKEGDKETFNFTLSFESEDFGSPFATIKQTARGISFEFTDEKADLAIHRLAQLSKRLAAMTKSQ